MMVYAWASGAKQLCHIILIKQMRLSLQYGVCETTPAAFASYGSLMSNLGKSGESFLFGELAERMLEKDEEGTIASKAYVLTIVHGDCHHWRRPLLSIAQSSSWKDIVLG